MKKDVVGFITCVFVIIILAAVCVYFSFKSKENIEFYGEVREVFNGYAILKVLDKDATNIDSDLIEIDADDFKVGDIVKVVCENNIQETYPPRAKVKNVTVIKENKSTTKEITSETTTKIVTVTTNPNLEITTTTKSSVENKESLMNSLENDYNLIDTYKSDISFGDKAKNYFITIVDFIFYNKPINGVYFEDLTASAKLKVIGIALKVDGIIEKYYPQYKEGLSESYKNAKSKLIELYLEYTTEYCDNNDEVCDQAKEDFQSLKKSLNITWDIIKELTNSGISKLKKWYEIYSGK